MSKTRGWNKEIARQNLLRFNNAIISEQEKMEKMMTIRFQQTLDYFQDLKDQIPSSSSGPLLSKTPKPVRKRTKRPMTIPENEVPDLSKRSSCESIDSDDEVYKVKRSSRLQKKESIIKTEIDDEESPKVKRATRASKRTTDHISRMTLEEYPEAKKSRVTKKQSEIKSEEIMEKVVATASKDTMRKEKLITARSLSIELERTLNELNEPLANETVTISKESEDKQNRKRTKLNSLNESGEVLPEEPPIKKPNIGKNSAGRSSDDISLYEDAMEKHNLLSSTMNASALQQHKKMQMNPLVILEPLLPLKVVSDETFVMPSKSSNSIKTNTSLPKKKSSDPVLKKQSSQGSVDSLITDDDDPEFVQKIQKTRVLRSSLLSEDDEVGMTPPAPAPPAPKVKTVEEIKKTFKNGALFSPYSKESVKKRVEAFEQVVAASPQKDPAPTTMRVTRTKTRALAAGKDADDKAPPSSKKKDEDTEESDSEAKENVKKKTELPKTRKYIQSQSKYMTPVGKNRIPVLSSAKKVYTPSNHYSATKPLTAARANNLVTNVDSFIPKSTSKISAIDKSDEKRQRKISTDDAKLKREIQLKAMTEEKKKKREIKERKIKEAREAKEKLEMEKRMRAEKEKEEKAKLALQAQEKARLQRLQEKEERRKKEQQIRELRANEQEELERQMAEQKKLEQELEKKRLAEMRAYQQAQAESMKMKLLAKKQAQKAAAAPNTYKLESEPDSDSDYESNPKYPIPEWATSSARYFPIMMQSYIPKQAVMKLCNTSRCTPDLTELFVGISKHRLKRTSSAIWKSPPRYSLMAD